jgi:HAD superfamily hydrolase (TIGR01509 family)
MTPISAIAWDIDGTLIDSEPLHLAVLASVCDRLGFDVRPLGEAAFRGVHLPDVWTMLAPRLPPGADREAWIEAIIAAYEAEASTLRALPGVEDAMAAFAALGVRQVCVSNSHRRIVDANIGALGIGDTISFSLSLDDVAAGKPDPEPYARACAMLGLDPARVAAVEDSATGAASARAAGLFVVGYDPKGSAFPGADIAVADLAELPARLLLDPKAPLSAGE